MTALESEGIGELDDAIAAHWLWLRAKGIRVPGHDDGVSQSVVGARMRADDPPTDLLARLGPIEAMVALKETKGFESSKKSKLMGAVLDSLCRLSSFRNSVVGLQRVRESLARREAVAATSAADRALVDLSLDASHLVLVEKSFVEIVRRAGWGHRSLKRFRLALAKRARAFRKGGFHPGLPGVSRAMFLARWIEGRLVDLLIDINHFREETRGGPGSEPLGYSGVPDAKALRRVQAECARVVKKGGATYRLVQKLFPASHPDEPKRRPMDRVRKRIKRTKSS